MPPQKSLQLQLAKRPTNHIVLGETFEHVTTDTPTASSLKDGQLLLETLYVSIDPAMRGWLDDARSYVPPVEIGAIMRGSTIARVLSSKSSKAKEGDIVVAQSGWREYAILDEKAVNEPISLPKNANPTDLLGALGMTGLTAYFGLMKHGDIQKGDTVVVSGAAGATGSVVVQLAKILGAGTIIGIAGSDDKCEWIKELGCDVALNYKDEDFQKKFKEATPNYIDVYYDNVGGDILDAALARANKFARFVECGVISQYNAGKDAKGPKNVFNIVKQRIRMHGFIVMDYASEYPEAQKQLIKWIDEGKLKSKTHVIKGGLKIADKALAEIFDGKNTGKTLVEVKNPEDKARI